MNRFGCPVVAPFYWQPTRDGLKGLAASTTGGAAQGAATGASLGSAVPGVGTAIGLIAGAIGGAIASTLNRKDPEQTNFDQAVAMWQVNPNSVYNIGNKYLPLAGLFDLKLNNPQIPIYRKYGRMGEQRFVTDMVNVIYQAGQKGQITASDTPLTVMSRIVQPWIDSWGYGPMVDPHADLIQKLMTGMVADYVSGNQTSWHAVGGDYPFGSLPKFALPAAVAAPAAAAPAAAVAAPTVNPVGSAPPVGAGSGQFSAVGTTLQHDTDASMLTPYGLFVSLAGGSYNFQPAGSAAQVQIALTPAHTGGAGTLQLQWTGNQVIATNNDGSLWSFNPTSQSFVQVSAATSAPAPAPAPAIVTVTPVGSAPAVPTVIPQVNQPSSTVATTSGGQPVTQADLQAMVAQLAAQGQSAQQAYDNAIAALQNNGVQATPQVQSAVQSAVQSTPAPATAGISSSSAPGWAIALGVVAVVFATARPEKQRRRRAGK